MPAGIAALDDDDVRAVPGPLTGFLERLHLANNVNSGGMDPPDGRGGITALRLLPPVRC